MQNEDLLEAAIRSYDFEHPEAVFIRHNENMTYRIQDGSKRFLLRIHLAKEGLDFTVHYGSTPRQIYIESEIELLRRLSDKSTTKLQQPVLNKQGEYVTCLDEDVFVTVLTWLDGESLVNSEITEKMVYRIGQMIGNLHNATASISDINRCEYDDTFIKRLSNELQVAYEFKHLDEESYTLMEKVLEYIRKILITEKQNYLLIHSDLSKSNIITDGRNLSPIDFSLSGYGIVEMELGDILCSLNQEEYSSVLIEGYETENGRRIKRNYIKCFMALSIIGYIVIHHNKVYGDSKFITSLKRWRETFFLPVVMQFESDNT